MCEKICKKSLRKRLMFFFSRLIKNFEYRKPSTFSNLILLFNIYMYIAYTAPKLFWKELGKKNIYHFFITMLNFEYPKKILQELWKEVFSSLNNQLNKGRQRSHFLLFSRKEDRNRPSAIRIWLGRGTIKKRNSFLIFKPLNVYWVLLEVVVGGRMGGVSQISNLVPFFSQIKLL